MDSTTQDYKTNMKSNERGIIQQQGLHCDKESREDRFTDILAIKYNG